MLMLPARHTADLLATCFALVAGVIGCGGGDEAPPMAPLEVPILDSGRPKPLPDSGYSQPVGGSCVEADMKPCKVLLPAHGNIHPCFVGVQICTDGKWSACIDPPGDAGLAEGGSAVN
jgi:hypothetical protein